jgi:uncharacterized iron-regulated membrane protein
MTKAAVLKATRLTHSYFGVFITPALLFFAFTGLLQTFGLHEAERDGDYKPAQWIVTLANIHKHQLAEVQHKAGPPPAAKAEPKPVAKPKHDDDDDDDADSPKAAAAKAPGTPAPERKHHSLPMKIFFAITCVGLFTSTATGLYMTYNYLSNKKLVTATLIAGTIIPLLLLLV